MHKEESFSADLPSVRAARHFVTEQLVGVPVDLDVVLLLVSELATNAVCHAHSDFSVHLHLNGPALRVEVRDTSPIEPVRRPIDHRQTSGRGVQLLEGLAAAWGSEARADGKVVWFEQPYLAEGQA